MCAVVLASTKEMDRQKWLELRREGIGGSDAAAISGLSKYKSPMAVWLEKTGQIGPEEAGEAAYWGTVLEDVVAREFSKQTGLKVKRKNAILRHPKYHFMIANLDRVVLGPERTILECKTAGEWAKEQWEEDRVPDAYMLQVQHYLAVTGHSYAYIAVLIGGNKFKYKRIERDPEIIDYLIKIESDFWKLVQDKTPPAIDGSQTSVEALKLLYPQSDPGKEIVLPAEAEEWLKSYDEAKKWIELWDIKKTEAENHIKSLMETAEVGVLGERKISWKSVISNKVDAKALKEELPDIYKRFVKQSESRRFLVK